MKLRNKKTGEIWTTAVVNSYACGAGYRLLVAKDAYTQGGKHYDSLAELNEEWEDYKPAESLIKDKKIRKAVRAWAEANSIKEIIIFDHCNNAPYTPVGAVEFAGNASRLKVLFRTEERFDTNRIYAISELCGEEEECEN